MSEDSITSELEKIKFHISLILDTVDFKAHPVEYLVVSKNWGRDDLNAAHDIFDKWEKVLDNGGSIEQHKFEADFRDRLGLSYQGVKSVVLAFYQNYQWTTVCEAFVDSMGPHPSAEYLPIKRRERF